MPVAGDRGRGEQRREPGSARRGGNRAEVVQRPGYGRVDLVGVERRRSGTSDRDQERHHPDQPTPEGNRGEPAGAALSGCDSAPQAAEKPDEEEQAGADDRDPELDPALVVGEERPPVLGRGVGGGEVGAEDAETNQDQNY